MRLPMIKSMSKKYCGCRNLILPLWKEVRYQALNTDLIQINRIGIYEKICVNVI